MASMSVLNRITAAFKGFTSGLPDTVGGDTSKGWGTLEDLLYSIYGVDVEKAFSQRLAYYVQADRILQDDKASRACEVYADFTVSPTDKSKVEVDVQGSAKGKQIVEGINKRINMQEMAWEFGYDAVSHGDGIYENVYHTDGKTLLALKKLPVRSMKKNLDERGNYIDYTTKAFTQFHPDTLTDLEDFPGWQILHINAANRMYNPYYPTYHYGFKRSILYRAMQRFIQHSQADKAAYISRLFFGMMMLVEYVDTGNLDHAAAQAWVKQKEKEFKQSLVTDSETGKIDLETYFNKNFFKHIFVPRSEKLNHSDLKLLATRVSSSMADIEYFRDEFITALRVPKYLLGYTKDVATRANGLSFTADFAKSCARYQACIRAALTGLYRSALYFNGIHYTNYELDIKFPLMGTVDNLMKHQILALQAQIFKTLAVEVQLPIEVVLKDFLDMDKEKVKVMVKNIGEYLPPVSAAPIGSPVPPTESILSSVQQILALENYPGMSIEDQENVKYLKEDIMQLGELIETKG